MEIHRERNSVSHVTITYNRSEDWRDGNEYDYTGEFAIHVMDENFNVVNMGIDEFKYEDYGFSSDDIEFFKLALKSQFVNAEARKKPRDVLSKFTSMFH
jgi:hypothetical protein